jgi:hypothetical protein
MDYYLGDTFRVYARPLEKDITVKGNNVLNLDVAEIVLTVVQVQ